ncbi:hypothetical protein AMS68_005860 [Peltaster fructicola]|uniref:Uncharacterized protein n=1 Tax=Peltaster fructicola TaxID=286661 RepID=A0A6H0Y004_9PEZI|nr:hypothetical protein AMS68_005860 [Peltaster fructicola]
MLKQSNRPRAPSAATLRILYQLAYISSGTALGVGALCAEERRRRTQVVQKIADNAKRLRQHPRYKHNAALAVAGGEDGFQCEMLAHRRGGARSQEGASLGPELPSVIDNAYAYTSERVERVPRSKRRYTKASEDSLEAAIVVAEQQSDTTRTVPQPMALDEVDTMSDYETPLEFKNKHHVPLKRPATGRALPRHQSIAELRPTLDASRGTTIHADSLDQSRQSRMALVQTHDYRRKSLWSKFKSWRYWARSEDPGFWKTLSAADKLSIKQNLSNDVDQLFLLSKEHHSKEPEASLEQVEEVVQALLHLARGLGHLKIATTLLLWKIAVARVSDADLRLLNNTYTVFKSRGKTWEIGVRKDDGWLRTFRPLHGRLPAPSASANREHDVFKAGPHGLMLTAMTKDSILRWAPSTSQICTAVVECCRSLASMGYLGSAIYMMTALPLRDWAIDSINQLAQEFFRAATQSTQLDLCDLLLKWTGGSMLDDHIFNADINAYIDACGTTKAYGLLSTLFNDPSRQDSAKVGLLAKSTVLSTTSFLHLCHAFSDGPTRSKVYYDTCYKQLSEDQRRELRLRAADNAAARLMSLWTTKHNFKLTEREYLSAIHCVDETTARSLRLTMIRICLAAGEKSYAQEVFAGLSTLDHDVDSYLATMLACAHASDWSAVKALLELVGKSAQTEVHMHTIKQILELYAHEHPSDSVLNLGRRILEATGLAPNSVVSTLILQRAVAEERHDVFTKWFDVCKTHQWKVDIDTRLASTLLHKHAVTKRPDHSMTMGTAYTMSKLAPALYAGHMKDVVKEAISYDIRRYRHHRVEWQLKNAQERLQHLLHSPHHIAHPGTIWNKELTLYDNSKEQLEAALHEDDSTLDSYKLESVSVSSVDVPARLSRVHSDMLLALSSQRYKDVMALYQAGSDSNGHPRSTMALEIALEASLRMHEGDDEAARHILADAQSAGMNTASAIGPLLMHRVQQRSRILQDDVSEIMKAVMDYYRLRARSGRPASHLLAVATADKMIADGLPKEGVAVLKTVFRSEWTKRKALDVVALTVWIKAYVYSRDVTSICDLVQHILATQMRIDQTLIWTLKMAEHYPSILTKTPVRSFTKHEKERLRHCRRSCLQRKTEQKAKTSRYLPKLAFSMVELWHHQNGTTSPIRRKRQVVHKRREVIGRQSQQARPLLDCVESHGLPRAEV